MGLPDIKAQHDRENFDHEPYILEVQQHAPDPLTMIVKVQNNRMLKAIGVNTTKTKLQPAQEGKENTEYINSSVSSFLKTLKKHGFSVTREALSELDVLDLGCGSDDFQTSWTWPPLLCRGLHQMGTHVVGVDILHPNNNDEDEGWEFHRENLLRKGALDQFGNNSFDVVNISMLLGHTDSGGTSPDLFFRGINDPEYKEFEAELLNQALRILRPQGILIINHTCHYQKVLGKNMRFVFKKISEDGLENLPYTYLDAEGLVFEKE